MDNELNNALNYDDLEDPYCLYYDKEQNCMIDECGFPILMLFPTITPNDYFIFKAFKQDMVVYNKWGQRVELYYPNEEEE